MGNKLSTTRNPKYIQGGFIPKHPEKYFGNPTEIFLRSSWERRVSAWLDNNPSVLKWNSERVTVEYISPVDNHKHLYYIDFAAKIKTRNGIRDFLIEVKPKSQGLPPKISKRKKISTVLNEEKTFLVNQAKWEAAKKYAKRMGATFVVLTEEEIFGK